MTSVQFAASLSASCFYATRAMLQGRTLLDESLATALAEGAGELNQAIEEIGASRDRFLSHLVPLAATLDGNRELAETALTKTMGKGVAVAHGQWFARLIAQLEAAFVAFLKNSNQAEPPPTEIPIDESEQSLVELLRTRSQPLIEQWEARGPGLMKGIEKRLAENALVERAVVTLVHPLLGGGGLAHESYNAITFEAVLTNPFPELPEPVRLAWLASRLNLDLPIFSERLSAERFPLVTALATLPATLDAAADVEWVGRSDDMLEMAISRWIVKPAPSEQEGSTAARLAEIVRVWWETRVADRTDLSISLLALERMLAE